MINDLSETHLVISEKNPCLMVNFMYSSWNFFKMGKRRINHLMKLQVLTMKSTIHLSR